MKLLVIGGSQFVGRHLVEHALSAGYEVTMFNRGKTNPGIYPDVEEIHGDRDGGLDALKGRSWDVVVDTCGYVPRIVQQSAELLQDNVGKYVFVSSISVYQDFNDSDEAEGALQTLEDETIEAVTGASYGGLKVLCENVVTEIYGERAINVRAGFIVGRYDVAWRMPHLIHRYDSAGEKLAGRPEQPVQYIHATDMCKWMLNAAAQGTHGNYNLTGQPIRMDALLGEIVKQTGADAKPFYVGDAWLQEQEIAPVDGLNYWVPQEAEGIMNAPTQRAQDTGFTAMSLPEMVADVLPWSREKDWSSVPERVQSIALTAEREAALLKKYHDA